MTFQSQVNLAMGLGVIGELFSDGPTRAAPFILDSADAAYNVVGRAFTVKSEGVAQAGGAGTLPLAGILIHPKAYALQGAAAGALAPTLTLANDVVGEFLTMGEIIVTLPGAAAIGDYVVYNTTTGVLATTADPETPGAGNALLPNARVTRFTVSGAGLAVITLTN